MARPLPPSPSTSFDSSTTTTNLEEAASTIFSRSKAPPRPLTRLSSGSTSSAPSMARSIFGLSSRTDKGMPNEAACSAVRLEVGMPTISLSFPVLSNSPILATTNAAVEPVPRPNTMPLSTYSTALSAASFFRSSWVSVVDIALIDNLVGRMALRLVVVFKGLRLLVEKEEDKEKAGTEDEIAAPAAIATAIDSVTL
eukprot:Gb_35013 [translate_table: standard]